MPQDGDLRRLFRKYLPKVHWTTIESRSTESGIPDLNGAYAGTEFWIECKITKTYAIVLRPAQIAWILRRIRNGGNVFIAVRRRNRLTDEIWIVNGNQARELKLYGLRDPLPCIGWDGGPSAWPWDKILQMMI